MYQAQKILAENSGAPDTEAIEILRRTLEDADKTNDLVRHLQEGFVGGDFITEIVENFATKIAEAMQQHLQVSAKFLKKNKKFCAIFLIKNKIFCFS